MCFRVHLEVYVHKNPTRVGVSGEQVDKSLGYVCSDGSIITWVEEEI